jgi:RecG-like helicase
MTSVTIGEVTWRTRVRVTGRVRSVRVQPRAGVPTLECTLVDATGGIGVVFLGRRKVPGIHPGTTLAVEGRVGSYHDRLAILNPEYELLPPAA